MIDGDALWVSEKLSTVPEKYRTEYAWIIPMAQVNGCFECSPMLVWRTCYSAVRPDWTIADVAAMLDEFVKAKMLFRFQQDGKTYGFFVGIQKGGRLPKPSDRVKSAKFWQKGMVPGKELANFLGVTVNKVHKNYRDEVATNSRVGRDKVARKSPTGIGVGVGVGMGKGMGIGEGVGEGPTPADDGDSTGGTQPTFKPENPAPSETPGPTPKEAEPSTPAPQTNPLPHGESRKSSATPQTTQPSNPTLPAATLELAKHFLLTIGWDATDTNLKTTGKYLGPLVTEHGDKEVRRILAWAMAEVRFWKGNITGADLPVAMFTKKFDVLQEQASAPARPTDLTPVNVAFGK
jgi:hypothetical protein